MSRRPWGRDSLSPSLVPHEDQLVDKFPSPSLDVVLPGADEFRAPYITCFYEDHIVLRVRGGLLPAPIP